MTLIKAENRELTHSRYQSTKGIPTVKIRRPAARGYYLALTFGTLLSSQGADAHEPRPSGLRSRRLFHVTPPAAMVKPRVCDPGRPASSGDARYNRLPSGCIPAAARLLSDRHPVQPTGRGVCPRVPLRSRRAQRRSYVRPGAVSNRLGVTPDTRPPRRCHPPETRARGRAQPRSQGAEGPSRRTPAIDRLPLRRTSQPPGSQASSAGTTSASVTRSLLR